MAGLCTGEAKMAKGRFEDKVVLITGGSRGLGRAMSLGFAREGARVVVASRKVENCEAVVNEITAAGGEAVAIAAHTGDISSLDGLVTSSLEAFGRVDILVNNAGINVGFGALTDLSPESFDKMYQVNLRGPWYLASRLAPTMGEQGGGCVINLLSVAAHKPSAHMGFYAATKAGLEAMTKTMAQEWAPLNIRVNALAPGTYHSDLTDGAIAAIPGFEEGAKSQQLIKRIAESEEILNPVFYLASESYTTGITLVADGGMLTL
jgi:NAD(P)-dependent dehydrogenase (short-subunit alcohol dehydrogenase family)